MTATELLGMARASGVALVLAGDRLSWEADHQPPAELLAELAAHKVEIIAALCAANDTQAASEPTRNAWTIIRGGKPICCMVGAPCTRTEALAEARWRWPDAEIQES